MYYFCISFQYLCSIQKRHCHWHYYYYYYYYYYIYSYSKSIIRCLKLVQIFRRPKMYHFIQVWVFLCVLRKCMQIIYNFCSLRFYILFTRCVKLDYFLFTSVTFYTLTHIFFFSKLSREVTSSNVLTYLTFVNFVPFRSLPPLPPHIYLIQVLFWKYEMAEADNSS